MKCSLLNGTIVYKSVETVGCVHISMPNTVKRAMLVCAFCQDNAKEIYFIRSIHHEERALHNSVPSPKSFVFSPTEQNGATEQRTVNHALAGEDQPIGEIQLVHSRRHITRHRQMLFIVGQIVHNRLRQRPFRLTQHFMPIF